MVQQSSRPRPLSGAFRRIFSTSRRHPKSSKESSHQPQMAQPNPNPAAAAPLTGPAKLIAVTSLVEKLSEDLNSVSLLPQQRDAALEQLKIYGREPQDADPLFTKEAIEMLTRHAFNSPSSTTSRNALRVLCNALLLKPETRQMFVNLGYEAKVCSKLKSDNRDDEFLTSRILFLTTYGTNTNLVDLIKKHHLADAINKNLERHAKRRTAASSVPVTDPMENMALSETLKLLFNVTHYCKDHVSSFTPAIPHIVAMLCKGVFQTTKPLDLPISALVNALLNLEIDSKDVRGSLYPHDEPNMLADRLVDLLTRSSNAYNDDELETTVTPLVGAIRAIHEYAPADVRDSIRTSLLPKDSDRTQVLGRSNSLPSWLLKNSTNAMTPQLRETISNLFFDMSDKDASTFVENVGYGFASGFLFSRGLAVPQNASEANARGNPDRPVNPITGQFLDAERQPEGPEMTEEEREREAERLFVLFERLNANGVMSVENPLRTAVQEGRFEELPDDYESD
ncbi:guanine nucleotide exchange factor [Hypoxylon cercidicola]|nr:guanine nucleotide exchange factor [Hypoxylon cercidicola]